MVEVTASNGYTGATMHTTEGWRNRSDLSIGLEQVQLLGSTEVQRTGSTGPESHQVSNIIICSKIIIKRLLLSVFGKSHY